MSLLEHIPTKLRKVATTGGGEYKGPCPWCGGNDRFSVSPEKGETGLWICRQCERSGDGIDFLRMYHNRSFEDACRVLGVGHKVQREKAPSVPSQDWGDVADSPCAEWQSRAIALIRQCESWLWSEKGERALSWLRGRGLRDETIRAGRFGYNVVDRHEKPSLWGIRHDKDIWIPRGITIPWVLNGEVWRLNVRRPAGEPKYAGPAGSSNGLYLAYLIRPGFPVMLLEGEFDAWTVMQAAGDVCAAVATGSTSGSRLMKWIARLSLASSVLVGYDADAGGEKAAKYWTQALPNAIRWRPYWGDVNQMLQDGADVRAWVEAGLKHVT